MLRGEHSAIRLIFIKLPFVIKTFVLSIFEWPFYRGFTVYILSRPISNCFIGFHIACFREKSILKCSCLYAADVKSR